MKPIKFFAIALGCFLASYMHGQFWQNQYPHTTTLTSGQLCPFNGGYIMAGFDPGAAGASNDFVIDKVDANGSMAGIGSFSEGYDIYDNNCSGNPARRYNCVGISVVEASNPTASGDVYALAGANYQSVFFAMLNATGVVTKTYRWDFPPAAFVLDIGKPFIRESSTPGEYFICGSYNFDSYVIRVNANPATPMQVWANWYYSGRIMARALIESTSNSNELLVVGAAEISPTPFTSYDAFLLKLDANNGSLIFYNTYEKQLAGNEWFNCIEKAHCTDPADCAASPNQYILGGRSQHPTLPYPSGTNWWYPSWMCKLDDGGSVKWSSLIVPFASNYDPNNTLPSDDIADVFERQNTNGAYEYYGVSKARICPNRSAGSPRGYSLSDNLVVFRLDQNGLITLSPDEFHHVAGESPMLHFSYNGANLTKMEGTTSDGYQAYGTDPVSGSHYMVKAYFNGVSGCNDTIVDIDSVHAGPNVINNPPLNWYAFDSGCQDRFSLVQSSLGTSENSLCNATSVAGGSNARPATTGISTRAGVTNEVHIYPNPTTEHAVVKYYAPDGSRAKIALYTISGQLLKQAEVSPLGSGMQQVIIDFKTLNAESGVYFVEININNETSRTKVIYDKD